MRGTNPMKMTLLVVTLMASITGCKTQEVAVPVIDDLTGVAPQSPDLTNFKSPMASARDSHIAILLEDGTVLVVGGDRDAHTSFSEVYDPSTDSWSVGAEPVVANRANGHAVRLNDGRVLILGGQKPLTPTGGWIPALELEIYDPADGQFHAVGSFAHSRSGASATLLQDGRVLIAGGSDFDSVQIKNILFADAEIFDPSTGTRSPTFQAMKIGRAGHSATLMADGNVLVAGGTSDRAEVFNRSSEAFVETNRLRIPRTGHTGFLLSNGDPLIFGGYTGDTSTPVLQLESYRSAFDFLSDIAATNVFRGAAVQDHDSRILVFGGTSAANAYPHDVIQIFNESLMKFESVGHLAEARVNHQVTELSDGSFLITGGWVHRPGSTDSASNTVEILSGL